MKIPKYVQKLLDKRCDYAERLSKTSGELDDWLEKNDIKCEDYDICTGCEIYVNPLDSKLRIMEAIRNHPTEKGRWKEWNVENAWRTGGK